MIGIWAALLPRTTSSESCTAIDLPSLAVWALQFSPRVALPEEAVLVEVGASARLIGGLGHLRKRIEAEGAELGVDAIAWAPNRHGRADLAAFAFAERIRRPAAMGAGQAPARIHHRRGP